MKYPFISVLFFAANASAQKISIIEGNAVIKYITAEPFIMYKKLTSVIWFA